MTHKERILATIQGKPTDSLPFIPRMDLWYKSNKRKGTLPDKYRNASLIDIVDDLGIGYHYNIPDYDDYIDLLDIVDRGLGIYRLANSPYQVVLKGVKRNITYQDDITIVEYNTPYGNIRTKVLFNENMWKSGITISHVMEYPIKSVKDYHAVGYIFENAEVIPTYDKYIQFQDYIGERGIVVARASVGGSPMQYIEHELMPYDLFFYHYYEHLDELKQLADSISKYIDKVLNTIVLCPAEIVFAGSNFDTNITWPPFFKEYITPYLSSISNTLHKCGKFLMAHTDGENKGLLSEYVDSGIDIADSICPAPMTSLSLAEIRKALAGKITIWGGIPSNCVLKSTMSDYHFEQYLNQLFEDIGTGDHIILSIADTTPPDAEFSRIERILKMAEDFGPVHTKK
ncbi:MAG: uroporphyrinogen decarboxylase family protein [Dehalobacterium sp.]